jgi:hypothetical protein
MCSVAAAAGWKGGLVNLPPAATEADVPQGGDTAPELVELLAEFATAAVHCGALQRGSVAAGRARAAGRPCAAHRRAHARQ